MPAPARPARATGNQRRAWITAGAILVGVAALIAGPAFGRSAASPTPTPSVAPTEAASAAAQNSTDASAAPESTTPALDLPAGVGIDSCRMDYNGYSGGTGFVYLKLRNTTDRNWNFQVTVDVIQRGEVVGSVSDGGVLRPTNAQSTESGIGNGVQLRYDPTTSTPTCTVSSASAT